jgi:hypothetical protein
VVQELRLSITAALVVDEQSVPVKLSSDNVRHLIYQLEQSNKQNTSTLSCNNFTDLFDLCQKILNEGVIIERSNSTAWELLVLSSRKKFLTKLRQQFDIQDLRTHFAEFV